MLGYNKADATAFAPDHARQLIAKKTRKPGSKTAAAKQPPSQGAAARSVSDAAVKSRAPADDAPRASGVVTQLDEYTQKLIEGDDPIDAQLLELEGKFPGMRFRAINPLLSQVPGPQFQPVRDDEGKQITVGDLVVGFMPEDVYDKAYRQPNFKRSKSMAGQAADGTLHGTRKYSPEEEAAVPVEGQGFKARRSEAEI